MTMPFYVAPEQFMKDKADFARKGIARGRSLVAVVYDGGILLAAENPSHTLRKISEIYDRIAFAGVGKYNEFDSLRQAGVRYADVEGYRYSREDVHAKALANAYAQILGNTFTHDVKPMEVEILVAEVGSSPDDDELFHILYDGVVVDKTGYAVLGGETEAIEARMKDGFAEGFPLPAAVQAAVNALAGPDRSLAAADLEAAVLERATPRRAFRRLQNGELTELLGAGGTAPTGGGEPPTPSEPAG